MRFITGMVLLLLASPTLAAQAIHKNARIYIAEMPEGLHSSIESEISRRRIPVNLVPTLEQAQLKMREASGFTGTARHRENIRLIIEVVDARGRMVWPTSAGERYYWVERAGSGWQDQVANQVVEKLNRGVQRYQSSASTTDNWWPWAKEKPEERTAYTPTEVKTASSASPPAPGAGSRASLAADEAPHTEIEIDWNKKDLTPVQISFNPRPRKPVDETAGDSSEEPTERPVEELVEEPAEEPEQAVEEPITELAREIRMGMTEDEVRKNFGDPLEIDRTSHGVVFSYPELIVTFKGGTVTAVKFP